MPLTDEQRTKAVQWFAGKLGRCPMCGNQQWAIIDIVTLPIFYPGAGLTVGPSVPSLLLACERCACIQHFAAVQVGLLDADVLPSAAGTP